MIEEAISTSMQTQGISDWVEAHHGENSQTIVYADLLDKDYASIKPEDHEDTTQADHEYNAHNGGVVAGLGKILERDAVGDPPGCVGSEDIGRNHHGGFKGATWSELHGLTGHLVWGNDAKECTVLRQRREGLTV